MGRPVTTGWDRRHPAAPRISSSGTGCPSPSRLPGHGIGVPVTICRSQPSAASASSGKPAMAQVVVAAAASRRRTKRSSALRSPPL